MHAPSRLPHGQERDALVPSPALYALHLPRQAASYAISNADGSAHAPNIATSSHALRASSTRARTTKSKQQGSSRVMMATSVLGKRSRTLEEVASQSPPRKRATRRSAPQIYEDAEESLDIHSKRCTTRSSSARSRKSSTLKSKLHNASDLQTKDVGIRDAPQLDEQDENRAPTETVTSTPSAKRFCNVLDNVPSTPKHRIRAGGGLLTPRTPRTADAPDANCQSIYARAKQLFTQSAAPKKLIGREMEREQLKDFINQCKNSKSGGCTYVSGPPGTGKSALVHEVLQHFEDDSQVQISVINCVGLRSASNVYGKLLQDLISPQLPSKVAPELQLKKLFTTKGSAKTHVVVLDEIDSLVDADCETLYNVFEWALHSSSSLALIGIANALDLTDRFLPRLKAKGLKPQLLPFMPYSAQQIASIVGDKLRTLLSKDTTATADFVPCVHPAAIQLCGKKIASQTGDLRKAFSLVRRAIDQVEKEQIVKQGQIGSGVPAPLGELTNIPAQIKTPPTTPSKRANMSFTAEAAPRASIAHMAKLASSIFNNGTVSRLSGLNLQQKAVLCSLVQKETYRQERNPFITPTKTANRAPTVGELFVKYTALCKGGDGILQPLKDTEFRDVVASLETLGLVHESKVRSSSLLTPSSSTRNERNNNERRVASAVAEKEMRESLNGPGTDLLRRLLDEI